ncbi:MAG TPA: hypothetical protein VFK16_11890 [Gemmatimonadaceae bacterium]|jgi:hypothetical protein|nr:hypothetical protein [Gemmatimonadaceae bacterium]
MRQSHSFLSLLAAVAVMGVPATPAAAQQALPPVRPLGPIEHVTTEPMRAVSAVRELPGRRVLVNDIVAHRVLLLDSTLANPLAVADSTSSTANAYGNMPGGLIPYRGDSTLFIDPASLSMLVLNGNGGIARVMSVPHPRNAMALIGGPFGQTGFDPAGRLVYRGSLMPEIKPAQKGDDPKMAVPQFPDSAPILRVTLATRAEDTVAYYRLPPTNLSVVRTADGVRVTSKMNPMPVVDDWALMPDGTVAIVRGRDFHVDYIHPDGTRTSSPAIPFEWERLTDDLKVAVLDSARQVMEQRRQEMLDRLQATREAGGAAGKQGAGRASSGGRGGAERTMTVVMMGGSMATAESGPPRRGSATQTITLPPLQMVEPHELPDYRPAFSAGAVKCDLEGRLWIRTSQVRDGRPLYDVVNAQGELTDRVLLPAHRDLAGFGQGVVYLGVTDSTGVVHLERARMQ